MNYNDPDYKPIYEELSGVVYMERGRLTLDVCSRVYKDDVYDITGIVNFLNKEGDEIWYFDVDDYNVHTVNKLFDIDLEQLLCEDAYA